MNEYQKNLQQERDYLDKTVNFLERQIAIQDTNLQGRKKELIAARKDMWENTSHSSRDFTQLTEMNQYLSEVNIQTAHYMNDSKRIDNYKKVLSSPYFGRIDFVESGYQDREEIYIGLCNVTDPKTHKIYVYDWRAPISSMFYQYELGKANFKAPVGTIQGELVLKRQYKIKNAKLEYFFDCSLRINDEMLQEILSHNASPKMRNIVETIQKEQDVIIRDTNNELLLVQGVAGSGKTSVALHRIAFLLYNGLNELTSNNIIIVSPNAVFSKYISTVLPDLGEENVLQTTFDEIISKVFEGRFSHETKAEQIERLISRRSQGLKFRHENSNFKGSEEFIKILDRFISYYERRMIPFEDVYFNGTLLETRQQLKNRFLSNKVLPMSKQLLRLENMILDKIHTLQKIRLKKIEKIVQKSEGRDLEIKSFSRLLAIKEAKVFLKRLQKFTRVDYFDLYFKLIKNRQLFYRLAQDITLPSSIEDILTYTMQGFTKNQFTFEDCMALVYLKLKIEGVGVYSDIKHVVIDEAQDYSAMQYTIFKQLFPEAKYTVLGDINQTLENTPSLVLYDKIIKILNRKNFTKLFLNKGYRSSFEINTFNQQILGNTQSKALAFERHGTKPVVLQRESKALINQSIALDVKAFLKAGYKSIAIITKTQREAQTAYSQLKALLEVTLIQPNTGNIKKGVSIVSCSAAKGLEFDAVIVYDANNDNYSRGFDRNLLYVACTRALHELKLYFTKEKSPFLP